MTMATKNDIFQRYLKEYLKAKKFRKSEILTVVCAVTSMHRKAAIRKFHTLQMRDPARGDRRGRKVEYGPAETAALKDIWEAGSEVCAELLHPVLSEYINILQRDKMWTHGQAVTAKLRLMSLGTMKRRVGTFLKAGRGRKGLSATKPSALKILIPVFNGPWTDKPPGYGQIDTVVHCGRTLLGDYVYTLNYTDAATMLVIPRAQWNKGMRATQQSMQVIKGQMPFPWLGAHPDTGSEFINQFVYDWCQTEGIELSRSRPNQKNDNMYVEERNGHVVRKFIGYWRLDCPEAVAALNNVYDVLTPYLMHFVAVRRTALKEKIQSKYRRTYETKPLTPYQRIIAHPAVDEAVKMKLRKEHEQLNPLVLKLEIDKRLHCLYDVQRRYGQPNS